MSNKNTWKDLHSRVVDIVSTGKVQGGAISDLGEGESVRFYPFETYKAVSQWFGDARHHSVESGLNAIASDLEDAVQQWTSKDSYGVMESLSLMDFDETDEVQHLRRVRDDEEGPVFGWVEDGDPEEIGDPIDARFRFQSMLEAFVEISAFASKLNLSMSSEVMKKDLWTCKEVAEFEGIKPESIRKKISQHRRNNNGKDPIWVRRFPDSKRGFLVYTKTYLSEMRAS